jgi:hypothetical protein
MIINDFNIMGISFAPGKADASLFMDAQTVLPASIP